MGYKGKATIQIIDAKTGKIKDEITEENMVTNAVDNVLNGALNYLMTTNNNGLGGTYQWSQAFQFTLGLLQDLFGGVLVFSSAINEDPDHIIPTTAEMESNIGCGCQEASLSGDTVRGAINGQETVIGDDYCTFVWDFTTAQSNGDIAAICLTSNIGGATGLKQSVLPSSQYEHQTIKALDTGGMFNLRRDASRRCGLTKTKSNTSNNHGVLFDNNKIGWIYGDTLTFRNVSKPLENFFQLTGKNDRGAVPSNAPNDETLNIGTAYYNRWIRVLGSSQYCYTLEADLGYNTDQVVNRYDIAGTKVTYHLNMRPMTENVRAYLNTSSGTLNSLHRFIHNNKLYIIVSYLNDTTVKPNSIRIYRMDLEDSTGAYEVEETEVGSEFMTLMGVGTNRWKFIDSNPWRTSCIFNEIYFGSQNSQNHFIRINLGDLSIDDKHTDYCMASKAGYSSYREVPWAKLPWIGCDVNPGETGADCILGDLVLFTPYLATINNISRVLTKTAADTMKIIYTLTKTS